MVRQVEDELSRKTFLYIKNFAEEIRKQQKQGVQPSLNLGDLKKLQIPLPTLESQRKIVEKLDRQMQALEGVRFLKEEAQKRIEEILAGVWKE